MGSLVAAADCRLLAQVSGMRVVPTDAREPLDLKGHTLVMPGCGSLAHLGELCVDALVCTFGLSRVAILESRHLLPLAMASAWEAPGAQSVKLQLTTAAEIYQSTTVPKLSVMQLRSAVAEGRRQALTQELWAWACAEGVAEVVIVSSCSSHVKVDADIEADSDLRYVLFGDGPAPSATGLGPRLLPLSHGLPEEETGVEHSHDVAAVLRFLRGGGLARPLLLRAAEAVQEAGAAGHGAVPTGTELQFVPPPRTNCKCPGVLGLLGLTSDVLNFQLTEQLAVCSCNVLAHRLKLDPAPHLKRPPSWLFELEAASTNRRLWA